MGTSMEQVSVTFAGQKLVFPPQYFEKVCMENKHNRWARSKAQEYKSLYESYGSFPRFAREGIKAGYDLIDKSIDEVVQELIQSGYYDLDAESIHDVFGQTIFEAWEKVEELTEEVLQKTDSKIEEAKQYREFRKASRGRVIGGGFGISGAIKGMALAGSANAVSGLAHSIVNSVGNSFTRADYAKRLKQIYEQREMKELCCEAIEDCVKKVGLLVPAALDLLFEPDQRDRDLMTARTLRNNLPRIPQKDQAAKAAELLTVSAGDIETYQVLLPMFGDPDGVLYDLAERAGILQEFNGVRGQELAKRTAPIREQLKADVRSLSLQQIQDGKVDQLCSDAEKKILELGKEFGCDEQSLQMTMPIGEIRQTTATIILAKKQEDVNLRTVNGVTYETIDLAQQAKDFRAKGEKLISSCEGADYVALADILKQLQELDQQEPAGTVADLIEKIRLLYDKAEIEARTFHNTTLDTHEEYQRVEGDYNRLFHDCFPNGVDTTFQELQRAKEILDNSNCHQVAREYLDLYIVGKEKELTNKEAYERTRKKERKKAFVRNGIMIVVGAVMALVIIFIPLVSFKNEPISLLGVLSNCFLYFGQTKNSPWVISIIMAAVVIAILISAIREIKNGAKSFHVGLFITVCAFLVIAALTREFTCNMLLYISLALEFVFIGLSE